MAVTAPACVGGLRRVRSADSLHSLGVAPVPSATVTTAARSCRQPASPSCGVGHFTTGFSEHRRNFSTSAVPAVLDAGAVVHDFDVLAQAVRQEIVLESALHVPSYAAGQCMVAYGSPDIGPEPATGEEVEAPSSLASCLATPVGNVEEEVPMTSRLIAAGAERQAMASICASRLPTEQLLLLAEAEESVEVSERYLDMFIRVRRHRRAEFLDKVNSMLFAWSGECSE